MRARLDSSVVAAVLAVLVPLAACGDDDGGGSSGGSDASVNRPDGAVADGGPGPGSTDAGLSPFCQASDSTSLGLELIAENLPRPLYLTAPPNDPRLFILEQSGRIRVVVDGALLSTPFLDIRERVSDLENEQGLLGMAFHPDYARNGKFYVHHSDTNGDTLVAEYLVSDDPNLANKDSERTIYATDQPQSNHNGGSIDFGPDGYLYIALGDGGGSDDQHPGGPNGQNIETPLAALLRIDVDVEGAPYAIPADNPFVGTDGLDEIYAYGLRNPYRISFDRQTGDIYIGDVGQDTREEISVLSRDPEAGDYRAANFGWPIMEGNGCRGGGGGCTPPADYVPPVADYPHVGEICFSVTGGYVYRGHCLTAMRGRYFYADYCSPEVYSFVLAGGVATDAQEFASLVPPSGTISSFGQDAYGELYVMGWTGSAAGEFGNVYRIVAVE